MTVSKLCKKCGNMMQDVHPCKQFCDTCMDFKRYFTTEKKENLTGPPSPIGCRSLNPRR